MWRLVYLSTAFAAAMAKTLRSTSLITNKMHSTNKSKGMGMQRKGQVDDNVAYMTNLLETFLKYAEENGEHMSQYQLDLHNKLMAAEAMVTNEETRNVLVESIDSTEKSKEMAESMFQDMHTFFKNIELILGSTRTGGSGMGCADITCGAHASCTRTTRGAECVCDEGYQGDGKHCNPPAAFVPRKLLYDGPNGLSPQVRDLHVAVDGGRIAVVWRDISHGSGGFIKIGQVQNNQVSFAPAEKFAVKAFHPCVALTKDKKVVISYRDDDREGNGILVGAAIGISGIRGANKHLTWGKRKTFALIQSHQSALVAIGDNNFIVSYSDHKPSGKADGLMTAFGSSTLGAIGPKGEIETIGTFRFSEQAVTRIESILLNDKTFIVAFRGAKHTDELDKKKITRQEVSCVLGLRDGADLVFDPHPLHLEPTGTQFWARGLSLIGPNIFAYAYYSGLSQETKLTTIRVDPMTHRMTQMGSAVLNPGPTSYVNMVTMPYTGSSHTLTFYQPGDKDLIANICSVNEKDELQMCENTTLAPSVVSFDAAPLPSGRLLLLYAPGGVPFYQVVGLARS